MVSRRVSWSSSSSSSSSWSSSSSSPSCVFVAVVLRRCHLGCSCHRHRFRRHASMHCASSSPLSSSLLLSSGDVAAAAVTLSSSATSFSSLSRVVIVRADVVYASLFFASCHLLLLVIILPILHPLRCISFYLRLLLLILALLLLHPPSFRNQHQCKMSYARQRVEAGQTGVPVSAKKKPLGIHGQAICAPPRPPKFNVGRCASQCNGLRNKSPFMRSRSSNCKPTLNFGGTGGAPHIVLPCMPRGFFFADTGSRSSKGRSGRRGFRGRVRNEVSKARHEVCRSSETTWETTTSKNVEGRTLILSWDQGAGGASATGGYP